MRLPHPLFLLIVLLLPWITVSPAFGAAGPASESVTLTTPSGDLVGTLLIPKARQPLPVVLLIAGSGATDRDGNGPVAQVHNDYLKLLAEGLAAKGIATLRYDKRGLGESAKALTAENDLRFGAGIDDAAAWIGKLRADPRFSLVVVAGHSEGSLIGMVAAREAQADGFVSISGPGRPAADLLREQLAGALPPDLKAKTESVLQSLEAGKTVADVPAALATLFRPSVQGYLISWFRYDPAKEIARLKVPVLILQGTTDIQVTVEDAKLLAKALPAAQLRLLDGVNHILRAVPDDRQKQLASYGNPAAPLAPGVVSSIADFVGKLKKH